MELRKLARKKLPVLNEFLKQNLSEQDMKYSGIRGGKLNYDHPGFLYFGIFSGDVLAALWWIEVRGRKAIEASLAVAGAWRGSGILDSLHDRNEEIYAQHRIDHRFRVNDENTVMLDYYAKKGLTPAHRDGHLVIYEIFF